jgi:hypothetical protein
VAVQIEKHLVDDLEAAKNPETDVRADETIRFAMGDTEWEIDLTAANADRFRKRIKPYAEAGRRVAGARHRTRPVSARRKSAEIRTWAKGQGLTVNERGRIPGWVVDQFEAATR